MRRGLLGVVCSLSLSLALAWGCGDPNDLQIGPVMPPGATPIRKVDEDNVAQALGETPRAVAKSIGQDGKDPFPPAPPTAIGETKTLEGGITYETLKEGTGEEVKSGRVAVVHYVGTLADGSVFDSSRKRGNPAEFTLGSGNLIKGWELGIPGMKVGELRKLVIPPEMAYGSQKKPGIPPDSTLTFEVELMGVK
jgi:FKBP-type peptidyl-prolyl cis-trans isomerase